MELFLNSECNLVLILSFWQNKIFLQMTKYYFHYAHMQSQSDKDTGSKIHELDMNDNIFVII